jgi:hypothetical protein
VPALNTAGRAHSGDDGGADPAVSAALAAYAAGRGDEGAALAALAASRLLVPVVALRSETGQRAEGGFAGSVPPVGAEMALPSVIGADGRPALPVFTCLDALRRWRSDARPVPVPAARVWQAAAQEASAAVIDIAGPVPLAVEGARLAALAAGQPAPPPHRDPDVLAVAGGALAAERALIAGHRLLPGSGASGSARSDLFLEVRLAPGATLAQPAVGEAIERAVTKIMAGTGGRFRRGIEVAVTVAGA